VLVPGTVGAFLLFGVLDVLCLKLGLYDEEDNMVIELL
jgi:hypothetical protein